MILLLIFFLLIIIWYASGFFFGRPIKRKRNRWHAWGPYNQIWGYIDGDKKSLLPDSMPYPFNKIFTSLTYTQYVTDGNSGGYEGLSDEGKKIAYHKATIIDGVKHPIRKVTEEITRIRKTETHPYLIPVVLPKSGFTFYLNFTKKIKIFNPMKTLKLDNFLEFVGIELNDAVFPWAVEKEKEIIGTRDVDDVTKKEVMDFFVGLKIDNDRSIMIGTRTLKDYMNLKIKPYGMLNREYSLDVGYDENVKKILDARNKQTLQGEETTLQEKISKTRDVERLREIADRTADRDLDQKYLKEVQKPLIEALAEGARKANEAYKATTLFIGGNEQNSFAAAVTAALINKEKGGQNANTN